METGQPLFIVGQVFGDPLRQWEFQGIFDTEQAAVDACGAHKNYFVTPVVLNEAVPHERVVAPAGSFWPNGWTSDAEGAMNQQNTG
jgi:hypothetical protein